MILTFVIVDVWSFDIPLFYPYLFYMYVRPSKFKINKFI